MRSLIVLAAMAAIATTGAAQQGRPAWKVRLDAGHGAPGDSTLALETMPPGWHVTTGRNSGIFYDPAWLATGGYAVEATVFLFPDSKLEGYGAFLGGTDLDGSGQRYLYVLLRRDGKFLVKRREGTDTHEMVPWTAHPAIAQPTDKPAKNVLEITVGAEQVDIEVNGQPLMSLQRSTIPGSLDGQVGLRLNHGVNLHVTSVKVTPTG